MTVSAAATMKLGLPATASGGDLKVIVNPSVSQPQTFDLGGRYVLPGGKTARAVTLQPTTALILRRA